MILDKIVRKDLILTIYHTLTPKHQKSQPFIIMIILGPYETNQSITGDSGDTNLLYHCSIFCKSKPNELQNDDQSHN